MEKVLEFLPVDYDYFDYGGRNYVRMVGRDDEGRKVCVVDFYDANFYLILEDGADEKRIVEEVSRVEVEKSGRVSRVLRCEVMDKHFLGKKVRAVRVFVSNHKDLQDFASATGEVEGISKRREFDLNLVTKYIKERGVEPLKWYQVEVGESDVLRNVEGLDVDGVYFIEGIERLNATRDVNLKIFAYDIETAGRDVGEDEVYMISLVGENFKKAFSWRCEGEVADYVFECRDEADMLEKFCDFVRDLRPDVLCGYFSDGFDLPVLKARAERLGVELDLGVDGRSPVFKRGRIPSGKLSGVVHVDLFRFVDAVFSQYLKSETLSLNEVAGELVGARKEDFDFARLKNMEKGDWDDFMSYNLQDSVATYELAMKLWPDMKEFCGIVKEPLFEVTRDRMSRHVENHILHNLDRFDEIAERRPGHDEIGRRRRMTGFEGAFVYEPRPGFYEDIAMVDFTSMHSSLIVTYNICGQSLRLDDGTLTAEDRKDYWKSPEFKIDGRDTAVYFEKKAGFFTTLLSEVVDLRKAAKDRFKASGDVMDKASSNAYKLLANATFGYQGFFGARYYSYEAAAATLAFVRKLLEDTIKRFQDEGFEVLYGDTDSVAFLKKGRSEDEIRGILRDINDKFPGIIELDLEGFFDHGLFVAKRDSKVGAKKKYALRGADGKIKIRGFETVRRDWCRLARELQDRVLRLILEDGNEERAMKEVRKVVERLKGREVDLSKLVVRTKLKRDVENYVTAGPHVVAARKMIERGDKVGVGTAVEYFVGEGTGRRVGDRVFLRDEKAKYDVEYYLKKQVLPAVEGIFDVFGVGVEAVLDGEEQRTLF
jgi:DNA polymerase I